MSLILGWLFATIDVEGTWYGSNKKGTDRGCLVEGITKDTALMGPQNGMDDQVGTAIGSATLLKELAGKVVEFMLVFTHKKHQTRRLNLQQLECHTCPVQRTLAFEKGKASESAVSKAEYGTASHVSVVNFPDDSRKKSFMTRQWKTCRNDRE
ncbi:hypothetical protein AK812_SmicGene37434, partial [Symbiodinium microadriaticum]